MQSMLHVIYPMRAFSAGATVASQKFTVSNSATTVTTLYSVPPVKMVTFDVQTQNVVARWDGTAPTATTGHVLVAGAAYTWDAEQFNNCQFIRQGSTDAVIFCSAMTC